MSEKDRRDKQKRTKNKQSGEAKETRKEGDSVKNTLIILVNI